MGTLGDVATATKAERAVKRFLSTPGWESGEETLRLPNDNVKESELLRRSKCPLLAGSGRSPADGDGVARVAIRVQYPPVYPVLVTGE